MNQTLFERWVMDQLNQNEDTQKTKVKREKKKPKSKEYQQNIKEMTELEVLFSQMTLSDKKQKQQSIIKVDFEQLSDFSSVQNEEFLKWLLSQLRLLFSQRKVTLAQNKIDSLFNLLFDEKEIEFLEQGICSRLGIENDSFSTQEQKIFLKNIFNNIFEV
ncbi:unnamed protein product [Paramecium primaurelia]|uniref:Uncharacterized protein n=1 Tax=Paramecium primaurelia TaxID=5886 RepID=A0A8S1QRN4_PARPR|nr:unnamed protein product [Paramecium primaurelia]CAD8087521.1 unnamed protein product [Paramecium primaurelia]CAD8117772.1 unnamed protein product [Paramecium primaurelia]